MSRPLLAYVHSPVTVQLVLPLSTRWASPSLSQLIRTLLCAKCPEETNRSNTWMVFSYFSCARISSFSSLSGALKAPLPRTRLKLAPIARIASSSSGSFNS
jgi:hypothetical protein